MATNSPEPDTPTLTRQQDGRAAVDKGGLQDSDGAFLIPLSESLLGCAEVCRRLDVSRVTLQQWVTDGIFPAPVKLETGTIRWLGSEVEAWFRRVAELPRVTYRAAMPRKAER